MPHSLHRQRPFTAAPRLCKTRTSSYPWKRKSGNSKPGFVTDTVISRQAQHLFSIRWCFHLHFCRPEPEMGCNPGIQSAGRQTYYSAYPSHCNGLAIFTLASSPFPLSEIGIVLSDSGRLASVFNNLVGSIWKQVSRSKIHPLFAYCHPQIMYMFDLGDASRGAGEVARSSIC